MGNVSKGQQPDYRADNSRRPPMGLQCSEKLPHLEASFSWPLKKMYTSTLIMDVILNSELKTRNYYNVEHNFVYFIGHALEDLCLDDIDLNSLDKELDRDDTNSLSSSISAGISSGKII